MNAKPKAIILTGYGINCDLETEYAFNKAGAAAKRVHVNSLIENPKLLLDYQIMALPGGFSFGDHIGSGKVLSVKMLAHLRESLEKFLERDTLIIGICNGFQTLVKSGLLPNLDNKFTQQVSLTFNNSGKFEDRWVNLKVNSKSPCIWTKNLDRMYLPVRHGEGKIVVSDNKIIDLIEQKGLNAIVYCDRNGNEPGYPDNPNGSVKNIAGICNENGRIFGLMPHPEAYTDKMLHPRWTRDENNDTLGLFIFQNGVNYFN